MKKSDFICAVGVVLFFAPFFVSDNLYQLYRDLNHHFPYPVAFIKFFILAPFGEMLGLRIKNGVYYEKGFGLLPRAIVWGILGITLKMAFDIFSQGVPYMLANMGFNTEMESLLKGFSLKKLFVSFAIGATLNIFYAPILMVTHKVTDEHIRQTGGSIKGFFSPVNVSSHLTNLNWDVQWNFVFRKTIIFFWIPAQTINFMLPEEVRILVAALLSIVLGVLLAIASIMNKQEKE